MGSSSRPKFAAKTADEADDYFVDFIEKWRISVGNLKDFYLAGHSFGGYICGHYAYRYPQNIKKLLMLSPAGVPYVPPDFDVSQLRFKNGKKPSKLLKSIGKNVWNKKWSPFGVMRKSGALLGKKIIKSYLNKRMGDLPKEEFDIMLNYMHQIFMREGSTEYAIFICFQLGMFAVNPLENADRLGNPELNLPISFFYGDIDWMDQDGGKRVIEKNIYADSLSRLYIVSNSDHHMYLDNPQEFANLIIEDIENTKQNYYLVEEFNKHRMEVEGNLNHHENFEESKRNDMIEIT